MRKIRFRAWDKEKKEMITDGIEYTYRCLYLPSAPGDEIHTGVMSPSLDEYRRFELMQYTGLKDKNGKEIYEGDIVEVPYYYRETKVVVVTFNEEEGGAEQGKISVECYPFNSYDQNEDGYGLPCESNIIGNIHENPELLKD